ENDSFEIYNMVGECVYRSAATDKIDISNLKAGTYCLSITNENATIRKKFVKID
ncbi:MAG: T9SS type A sorting domain-containing protein, partial [Bacteroidales bacterium]|nr:T9SS type A sorting domain-containing protein [Bacteroidales bacterium]